jgi:tight adherence protein B
MSALRRIVLVTTLAALAVGLPAAAGAAGPTGVRVRAVDTSGYPTIRASVVTPTPSRFAPTLNENGTPVIGLQATNLADQKSVVLAVDRSQSMRGRPLEQAVAAARAFVRTKPASDRIAVTSFATTAVMLTGFSTGTIDTNAALGTISIDRKQGTKLYDDLLLATNTLSSEPLAGRVVIAVTDGNETKSSAGLDDVVAAARDARVSIYVVAIESSRFTPEPLKEIAAKTGGRYYGASSSAALAGVYASIARELARTWRVEYTTAARPGDTLKLAATVRGAGQGSTTVLVPGKASTSGKGFLPASLTSSSTSTLALALLVALLVLAAAAAAMATREGTWVRHRLEPHLAEAAAKRKGRAKQQRFAGFKKLAQATDTALGDVKHWRRLRRLLERANLPLRPGEFVWIAVGVGLLFGVFAAVAKAGPLVIVGAMLGGAVLPFGYAWFKASQRLRAFDNQLPDLLITIAASLKAGHSFRQGIQSVVEEGEPPASEEFNRVLTETRLGRPMDDALNEMGERVGSKNLDFVITAVTIQRQIGGSLAGLFDMVADAVRQRQAFARKIKGLTAMGRMSAYVLIGLPFFLAAVLTMINGTYMAPLWHTSTGHKLIFIGLGMMACGSAVLKKMVSFKG